jgi:hypothetical protein
MKNQKNIVYMFLIGLDSLFDREKEKLNISLYISMLVFDFDVLFKTSTFIFYLTGIRNKMLNL